MPLFLSEPPIIALVTLGVMALILGGLWLRYRRVVLLAGSGLLLVLLVVWVVLGLMFESPREESVRRVSDMADAVTEKNWAKFGENVSESFEAKGRKKADLKKVFDQGGAFNLRATAWDFALADPPRMTDTEVVIQFDGKATPPTGEPLLRHFEATFVKDPDGKFRMKTYKSFDFVQKNQPADVP